MGTKKVSLHLIDADGRAVVPPIEGQLYIEGPPVGLRWGTGKIMRYAGVKYPRYGT